MGNSLRPPTSSSSSPSASATGVIFTECPCCTIVSQKTSRQRHGIFGPLKVSRSRHSQWAKESIFRGIHVVLPHLGDARELVRGEVVFYIILAVKVRPGLLRGHTATHGRRGDRESGLTGLAVHAEHIEAAFKGKMPQLFLIESTSICRLERPLLFCRNSPCPSCNLMTCCHRHTVGKSRSTTRLPKPTHLHCGCCKTRTGHKPNKIARYVSDTRYLTCRVPLTTKTNCLTQIFAPYTGRKLQPGLRL